MPTLLSERRMNRRHQRGLSLVELMVGITVGLIIVAGASVLLSTQIVENRRLIAEAQLQQDLRATADIITRELRRSGTVGSDILMLGQIWILDNANPPRPNTRSAILTPTGGTAESVDFSYLPGGPGSDGPFGFRLDTSRGVIETLLVAGGWQDLTDPATANVTNFEIERLPDTEIVIPCNKPCPTTLDSSCWPTVSVRGLEVRITAQSRVLPEVVRTHRSRVRLRNDFFRFYQHVDVAGVTAVCPS
jgi:prepilin-type N-terminal cleavage/methylation domain-containing protein